MYCLAAKCSNALEQSQGDNWWGRRRETQVQLKEGKMVCVWWDYLNTGFFPKIIQFNKLPLLRTAAVWWPQKHPPSPLFYTLLIKPTAVGFWQWPYVGFGLKNEVFCAHRVKESLSRLSVFFYCFVHHFDSHRRLPQLRGLSFSRENPQTPRLGHALAESPTEPPRPLRRPWDDTAKRRPTSHFDRWNTQSILRFLSTFLCNTTMHFTSSN